MRSIGEREDGGKKEKRLLSPCPSLAGPSCLARSPSFLLPCGRPSELNSDYLSFLNSSPPSDGKGKTRRRVRVDSAEAVRKPRESALTRARRDSLTGAGEVGSSTNDMELKLIKFGLSSQCDFVPLKIHKLKKLCTQAQNCFCVPGKQEKGRISSNLCTNTSVML